MHREFKVKPYAVGILTLPAPKASVDDRAPPHNRVPEPAGLHGQNEDYALSGSPMAGLPGSIHSNPAQSRPPALPAALLLLANGGAAERRRVAEEE